MPVSPDPPPAEEWYLPAVRIGRRTCVYDRLDSTSTLALSLAADARNDGLVILAREQTAGRGQYGRSWLAPPDSSVLLSALVFPPPELRRPVLLTAWATVSVCELIRHITGRSPRIKWPNDVQVGGQKLAGILIEQRAAGPEALASVVGVGLNVHQPAAWFEEAGLREATSLACQSTDVPDTLAIARRLILVLDREYDRLLHGNLAALESSWKSALGLVGKPVHVELHNEQIMSGRIDDLTFSRVDLQEAGERLSIAPERIKQIRPV